MSVERFLVCRSAEVTEKHFNVWCNDNRLDTEFLIILIQIWPSMGQTNLTILIVAILQGQGGVRFHDWSILSVATTVACQQALKHCSKSKVDEQSHRRWVEWAELVTTSFSGPFPGTFSRSFFPGKRSCERGWASECPGTKFFTSHFVRQCLCSCCWQREPAHRLSWQTSPSLFSRTSKQPFFNKPSKCRFKKQLQSVHSYKISNWNMDIGNLFLWLY